ncbi:MAG TPA: hypothetical protein VK395_14015 [Gemmataceae bacterium]|nr:hypothetical protein [Gemmataceae bacterium]
MDTNPQQWVPKVHPATRSVEPEDPMTLHATAVPGDPEVMLRCLVQEFAWMGWDAEQIVPLFRDPFYPALNSLWCVHGEAGIRQRVQEALRQCAVLNVTATVVEEPESSESQPELIELGIRTNPHGPLQEGSHVKGI